MSDFTEDSILKAMKENADVKIPTGIMYSAQLLHEVINLATINERTRILNLMQKEQERTKLGFVQYKRVEELVNE